MLLAVVLLGLAVQTPAPAASPLKEIIRVTAKPLCTAIRERIGPSVAALLENDDAIAQGTHFIFEMGRDEGRPWMQMDKLHLENDISKLVRNLEVVDSILDAKQTDANGSDRYTIEQLQRRLRAIADTQRAELNVLDGTLESEQMAELMNSDLPTDLTSLGFPLSKLTGDEISSSAAAYTSQEPSATPAPTVLSPDDGRQIHTATGPTPTGIQPTSAVEPTGNPYSQLGAQAVAGIGYTKAVEAAFIRSFLPAAASCSRLQSPPR